MKVPEKGFYYHYKHDSKGSVNNYAYEVIGIGLHTEERTFSVIYRPFYKNGFLGQSDFCSRPLEMFMEDVEVNGKRIPRFTQIQDQKVIEAIKKVFNQERQS